MEFPEYSVAKKALENNIAQATNVDFISQYAFGEGSTNVRDSVVPQSGQVRQSFGSSSTAVRQVVEGQSKRSRTAPEQDSKECRTRLEAESNNSRTGVEQKKAKSTISDVFLTAKIVFDVRSVYGLFTNALLKRYQKGTGNVLESYQRATGNSNIAEHGLACARQLWQFSFPCIAQASVMRMLSNGNAWIVRKTVPVYALLTHYQRFIYASSILNPYTESALSKIRRFKRSNFFCQVSEWFCINNLSSGVKCFSNQVQGGGRNVVNERFVSRLPKSTFSTVLLLLLLMTFGSVYVQAQSMQNYVLQGTVISAVDKKPLQAVSVRVEADNVKTSTKKDGSFSIAVAQRTGKVKFTSVGYKTLELDYTPGVVLSVQLNPVENQLDEVEVVSTGYQKIPKERATGSFEFVDNKLFNRKVSTDFVSRLEDIVPGLSSVKYFSNNRGNLLNINIRGESTLRSEKWPLVVIDGVPSERRFGDLGFGTFNNVNPNDVESVTVLKDAAAASIWGAKAGNGVIVITTKKAKFNERTNISFNSNVSIKNRPDLYTYPQMPTSDYIDLVQQLFNAGRYNSDLNYFGSNPEPIVWIMKDHRDNKISEVELKSRLDQLRGIDMRDDFMQYIYRKTINQQYSLRLNAGGEKVNTSIGIGYDKNLEELVTSDYNRVNLQSNTQFKPVDRLLIDLGITYTESRKNKSFLPVGYNGLAKGFSNYPYMQLADDLGNPLNIDIASFSPAFRDTVANGRLQDWTYNPLKELYDSKQTQRNRDLMANLSLKYSFPFGLTVGGLYAYQHNDNPITEWRGIGSFLQRDQINMFSSWDAKQVYWNMPVGDYLQDYIWNSTAHQGRLTAEYQRKWNKHDISLLTGYDIRWMDKELRVAQYYGYDPENGTFKPMHLGKEVPYLNGMFGTNTLPDQNNFQALYNRFVSYYGNGAYTYNDRYIISASFRKDASNLFGVKANDKGQPFWSIGGAWLVSKESFIDDRIFPLLKLRATYGYNGNVNTGVSAYPIMSISSNPNSITGQNYAQISTPPNPKLRWERVGNLNLGLDFALKGNILSGSIEYYRKTPKDLVAPGQLDPTAGFTSLTMNTANLDTRGWDVSLNIRPISRKNWEWNSNLVFANSRTLVTKAFLPTDLAWLNIGHELAVSRTAIEGMNLYSLLTYKWAGLDPENGTPRAYLNDEISKDYFAITGAPVSSLENHGSQIPVYFGSLRNSVRYKDFEFSWNISYQLGHKFIRSSFYNDTFLDLGFGHPDYALRWQKPGDELITDVPAFTYPNNATGSQVYKSSSVMVENAGQIKLRDIQCSLALPKMARYGLKNVRIYTYFQNIGTIWRGNKKGIDPEFGNWVPDPLMCSFGLNFNL